MQAEEMDECKNEISMSAKYCLLLLSAAAGLLLAGCQPSYSAEMSIPLSAAVQKPQSLLSSTPASAGPPQGEQPAPSF